MHKQSVVEIGYFPFRGQAQVPRLLCEFLGIPYKDKLFRSPDEWNEFKAAYTESWVYREIPFLRYDGFVVTGCEAITHYIAEKFQMESLLGNNFDDQQLVYYFETSNFQQKLFSTYMEYARKNDPMCQQAMMRLWKDKILPRLLQFQCLVRGDFCLGYLSLIDFYLYELKVILVRIYGNEVQANLPRLIKCAQNVGQIGTIQQYENSSRCIKEHCPLNFMKTHVDLIKNKHQCQ